MIHSSESKADGLNYIKIKGDVRTPNEGGSPRSIRKRGFWRAFKRKELWAIVSFQTHAMMNDVMRSLYSRVIQDVNVPNGLLHMTYPIENKMVGLLEIINATAESSINK